MSIIASSSASRTGLSASGQRVAEQHDLHALGRGGQDRREDVALGLHAERRVVVLVQHDAVEADLLGEPVVLEVLVVEPAAGDRDRSACWRTSARWRRTRGPSSAGYADIGCSVKYMRCMVSSSQAWVTKRVDERASSSSGFSISTKCPAPSTISSVACGERLGVALAALERHDAVVAAPHDQRRGGDAAEQVRQRRVVHVRLPGDAERHLAVEVPLLERGRWSARRRRSDRTRAWSAKPSRT